MYQLTEKGIDYYGKINAFWLALTNLPGSCHDLYLEDVSSDDDLVVVGILSGILNGKFDLVDELGQEQVDEYVKKGLLKRV